MIKKRGKAAKYDWHWVWVAFMLLGIVMFAAGMAGAEESRLCRDADGARHDFCFYRFHDCTDTGCKQTMVPANSDGTEKITCLAKMEAALSAVEPWLGYSPKDDSSPGDFKRARALFYETKKACWRDK